MNLNPLKALSVIQNKQLGVSIEPKKSVVEKVLPKEDAQKVQENLDLILNNGMKALEKPPLEEHHPNLAEIESKTEVEPPTLIDKLNGIKPKPELVGMEGEEGTWMEKKE